MKIIVKVKPNAKKENIERIDQPQLDFNIFDKKMVQYKVSVKEPPINNKANQSVIRVLADYFGVSISQINLINGQLSKIKVFEILN